MKNIKLTLPEIQVINQMVRYPDALFGASESGAIGFLKDAADAADKQAAEGVKPEHIVVNATVPAKVQAFFLTALTDTPYMSLYNKCHDKG
jgi:hypothetical protein